MYSFEEVWTRIRDNLKNASSKIEGTFTMDNVQAVALEIAMIHATEIEPILDAVFLDTAEGNNLDRKGLEFNEARKAATPAKGQLLITGIPKMDIAMGTTASFGELLYSTAENLCLDENGNGTVMAKCTTPGAAGNAAAGAINRLSPQVSGVTSVTNPAPFEGGTNAEEDEAYRARLLEKIRSPITSGNENYYIYLAKQVPGVADAKCFGTWNGPGTVKVTVFADSGEPDDTLLARVREHIEQLRVIGAQVTVAGAQALPVRFEIKVLLNAGYGTEEVAQGITGQIRTYFEEIAFDKITEYLSYYKIIELAFREPGVADVLELKMNGQPAAVQIAPEEFCRLEGVAVHAD